jgi:hypothetical protein
MDSLFGLKVVPAPFPLRRAKLKLRPEVPVSDQFRASMDAWLLETFGEEEYALFLNPGAVGLDFLGGQMLVVNPNMIGLFKGWQP